MLDNFWKSIGTKVAECWVEYIFGPAFLFWAGGLGLYAWKTGWQAALHDVQTLTPFQQGVWLVLALLTLIFSSVLMQALRYPILRILEGYWPWPIHYLRPGIVTIRKWVYQRRMTELHELASVDRKKLSLAKNDRLIELEVWAHWQPVNARDLLPTALGNIMRARERSTDRKYGLDGIICWPRLWPLLPENLRSDLINARSVLDRLVELWFWGLLFWIWSIWMPWAVVIGLLWMLTTYWIACQAAMAYGELMETAFDLHRFSLYEMLGWPLPQSTQDEHTLGAQLTEYLWRGTLPAPITYRAKVNSSRSKGS
jgi:hypothetical protein